MNNYCIQIKTIFVVSPQNISTWSPWGPIIVPMMCKNLENTVPNYSFGPKDYGNMCDNCIQRQHL